MNGGMLTGTLFYNLGGVVAIGTSYTTGVGNTFYYDAQENSFDASINEIALITQFTFLRKEKIKAYGDFSIAQLSANTKEPVVTYWNGLKLKDDAIGMGFSIGGLLNLGGGLYWNFFEYRMRTTSSDFMDMDKGFQGSVGPMHTVKTGISYAFSSK